MAAEEMINATISRLRAAALEQYSLIKDTLKRPTQPGDLDILSSAAAVLAQLEGAMVTMQQYKQPLLDKLAEEELQLARRLAEPTEVEAEEEADPPEEESQMSEEELLSKSPTYKHSVDVAKMKGLID